MNDLNKISVFKSYFEPVPALEITLHDFCANVINGDYATEITALRAEKEKKQRDSIKATLPAVTISGTFAPTRAKENLQTHSGFICLDIDQQHNPDISDWTALRDGLAGIENIYFAALSASAKGVFLIVPISNQDKHELRFTALQMDFESIGLIIDKSCRDVSRLRGISYDKDAVLNPDALTYKRVYIPPAPKQYIHTSAKSPKIEKLIEWAVKKAPFVNGSRHEFIKLLAGACHRFGISESETNSELLRYQQQDFKATEIENIIKYIYANSTYKNSAL